MLQCWSWHLDAAVCKDIAWIRLCRPGMQQLKMYLAQQVNNIYGLAFLFRKMWFIDCSCKDSIHIVCITYCQRWKAGRECGNKTAHLVLNVNQNPVGLHLVFLHTAISMVWQWHHKHCLWCHGYAVRNGDWVTEMDEIPNAPLSVKFT